MKAVRLKIPPTHHPYFSSRSPAVNCEWGRVHLGLIYSWLATVGAEYFLAVGRGACGLIIAGRERFEMAWVMVGVIILGLGGFTPNRLVATAEVHVLR